MYIGTSCRIFPHTASAVSLTSLLRSRKECLSRGNVALATVVLVTVMATVLPGSIAEMVRATFTNVVYVLRVVVDAIVVCVVTWNTLDPS